VSSLLLRCSSFTLRHQHHFRETHLLVESFRNDSLGAMILSIVAFQKTQIRKPNHLHKVPKLSKTISPRSAGLSMDEGGPLLNMNFGVRSQTAVSATKEKRSHESWCSNASATDMLDLRGWAPAYERIYDGNHSTCGGGKDEGCLVD
jgi:hypothetical protein